MRQVVSSAIHTFVCEVFAGRTLHTHRVVKLLIDLDLESMTLLRLESVVDFTVRVHRSVLGRDGCVIRVVQTL